MEELQKQLELIQSLIKAYEVLNELKEKAIELDKQLEPKRIEYVPVYPNYPVYPQPYNPYPYPYPIITWQDGTSCDYPQITYTSN